MEEEEERLKCAWCVHVHKRVLCSHPCAFSADVVALVARHAAPLPGVGAGELKVELAASRGPTFLIENIRTKIVS